jgi:PBSX family phage terminase large subunit
MQVLQHHFEPRGAARAMMNSRASEILISGAAGTGKSRAVLEKINLMCLLTPGVRALIARKTARSLATSALRTWERDVVPEGIRTGAINFYGGSAREPAQYRYDNGSAVVIGGLDDPMKIMSTEYDCAFLQECTELTEEDWESVSIRLRNGALKSGLHQLIGDCNPSHPTHWLLERAKSGKLEHLVSAHEDNPRYFRADGTPTAEGVAYIARLDSLTGVRYLRLRKNIWAAAEGVIYESFDRNLHVIPRFPVPDNWERIWTIDFGFTNPFVWQDWALDHDRRAYLVREIYMTGRLVEDHARQIMALGGPAPSAVVVDHDAEDRATFERHTGFGTVPAHKAVTEGIELVESRLRLAGDGKPRMMFFEDALIERDPSLVERKLPTCTVDEIPGYIWAAEPPGGDRKQRQPVKRNDHGADAARYLTAEIDLHGPTNVRWG